VNDYFGKKNPYLTKNVSDVWKDIKEKWKNLSSSTKLAVKAGPALALSVPLIIGDTGCTRYERPESAYNNRLLQALEPGLEEGTLPDVVREDLEKKGLTPHGSVLTDSHRGAQFFFYETSKGKAVCVYTRDGNLYTYDAGIDGGIDGRYDIPVDGLVKEIATAREAREAENEQQFQCFREEHGQWLEEHAESNRPLREAEEFRAQHNPEYENSDE